MTDAPVFGGTGRPIKPVGLIASAFRPSDDATMYPFLIPSNIFAVLSLRQLEKIYREVLNDTVFADECADFADEVQDAINAYGVGRVQTHGLASQKGQKKNAEPHGRAAIHGEAMEGLEDRLIYAYEVDGFGNKVFMDDANVPSLMSLGYLDPKMKEREVYKNTREFLLSDDNPWFIRGKAAEGQGSPHTGKENIWPMGIILRAMTSTDKKEIAYCLKMLKNTHAGTGFMHESFHKDNAENFSRSWFAWANTLFGELILKVHRDFPEILK